MPLPGVISSSLKREPGKDHHREVNVKKVRVLIAAAVLTCTSAFAATDAKVPDGKENLTLDSMSKAREAAGKKVIKGPVPFAHQDHVARGVACKSCHHKQQPDAVPKACSECHKDTKGDAPKINDAFHGGSNEALPALESCIGCHSRTIADVMSKAPKKREPCDACHSLKKKWFLRRICG